MPVKRIKRTKVTTTTTTTTMVMTATPTTTTATRTSSSSSMLPRKHSLKRVLAHDPPFQAHVLCPHRARRSVHNLRSHPSTRHSLAPSFSPMPVQRRQRQRVHRVRHHLRPARLPSSPNWPATRLVPKAALLLCHPQHPNSTSPPVPRSEPTRNQTTWSRRKNARRATFLTLTSRALRTNLGGGTEPI